MVIFTHRGEKWSPLNLIYQQTREQTNRKLKRLTQTTIALHAVYESYVNVDDLIYFPYQKQYLS